MELARKSGMAEEVKYSIAVARYSRVPIYVRNPPSFRAMSKCFADFMQLAGEPEVFEYGDFVGDPRHILAVADNRDPALRHKLEEGGL